MIGVGKKLMCYSARDAESDFAVDAKLYATCGMAEIARAMTKCTSLSHFFSIISSENFPSKIGIISVFLAC